MQNNYEEKRQARIERIEERIAKLRKFAEGKDLSLFGESKSGIPMGQPILVGHHSERRHRRHLERINRLVQSGFDAHKKADQLESRLAAMKNAKIIQVDNPDAERLLKEKIEKLEKTVEAMKAMNKFIRSLAKYEGDKVTRLAELIEASPFKPTKYSSLQWASDLVKPDCFGNLGFASFTLTNTNAEIRRLKKRLVELQVIEERKDAWQDFEINGVEVKLNDGQVQVHFNGKPSEEIRNKLKRSPLVLKWSRFSGCWVRKYTASCGSYFITELKKVLSA